MVLPFAAVNTWSGTMAPSPIRLSVSATIAITLAFSFSLAMASMAEITAAAPAISVFMPGMPVDVLMEYPPVSYITPLPTRAMGFSNLSFPLYLMRISLGSSLEPLFTPRYDPMFISSICFLSYKVTSMLS